jgi:hypothetical protein
MFCRALCRVPCTLCRVSWPLLTCTGSYEFSTSQRCFLRKAKRFSRVTLKITHNNWGCRDFKSIFDHFYGNGLFLDQKWAKKTHICPPKWHLTLFSTPCAGSLHRALDPAQGWVAPFPVHPAEHQSRAWWVGRRSNKIDLGQTYNVLKKICCLGLRRGTVMSPAAHTL